MVKSERKNLVKVEQVPTRINKNNSFEDNGPPLVTQNETEDLSESSRNSEKSKHNSYEHQYRNDANLSSRIPN